MPVCQLLASVLFVLEVGRRLTINNKNVTILFSVPLYLDIDCSLQCLSVALNEWCGDDDFDDAADDNDADAASDNDDNGSGQDNRGTLEAATLDSLKWSASSEIRSSAWLCWVFQQPA